ncbi:MAG: hypothetical protein GDA53_02040 [Rhodobacteraceae bacterium]|nr:hypothetical protein [Paracoccaceae bacterium]
MCSSKIRNARFQSLRDPETPGSNLQAASPAIRFDTSAAIGAETGNPVRASEELKRVPESIDTNCQETGVLTDESPSAGRATVKAGLAGMTRSQAGRKIRYPGLREERHTLLWQEDDELIGNRAGSSREADTFVFRT